MFTEGYKKVCCTYSIEAVLILQVVHCLEFVPFKNHIYTTVSLEGLPVELYLAQVSGTLLQQHETQHALISQASEKALAVHTELCDAAAYCWYLKYMLA